MHIRGICLQLIVKKIARRSPGGPRSSLTASIVPVQTDGSYKEFPDQRFILSNTGGKTLVLGTSVAVSGNRQPDGRGANGSGTWQERRDRGAEVGLGRQGARALVNRDTVQ